MEQPGVGYGQKKKLCWSKKIQIWGTLTMKSHLKRKGSRKLQRPPSWEKLKNVRKKEPFHLCVQKLNRHIEVAEQRNSAGGEKNPSSGI